LSALWTNADYLKANFGIVLKNIKFFDGRRIRDAELKELAEQTLTALSDFLYYHVYLNEWIELKNFWGELLAEYDKRKLMTGRLTYSDISDYTYINMYDPEISIINPENGIVTNRFYEFLSYRTRFLLIDEFQDTSVIQFKVFQPMIEELLSGDGVYPYGGVIIVGDEKQAIYQWRSGERDLILKLENQYQTEQSKLDTCFRSSRNVMDFINVLFQSEKIQQYAKENDFEWIYDGDVICHRNDTPGCVKLRDFAYGSGEDDGDKRDIYPDFVDEFLIPNLTDKNGVFNCANTAVIARTNKELNSIASVLTLKGIPFVQESNNSLFHHEAIKPILFLMDYIIYRDRLSLLKFYRSAVYLISNTDMKMYMQNNIRLSDEEFESYLDGLPGMDKVRSLNEFYNSPMLFITKAFEAFNFLSIFETENEKKNLDKFLSIASSFEKERHEFSRNIAGFLLYCKEMEKEEGNVQETVTGDDAVTLISVHKSKGLAFCNVFAFNILGEAGGRGAGLIMNYRFDEVYRNLDGYDISLRCKEILKHTTKTDVISRMESSERMQELNTIYVALTRAEDNLFLYYAKKIKKDGEIGAGGETGRIVYESAKEILTDHQYEISEPCFNDKQDSQITTGSQVPDLKGYFLTDHRSLIEEIPEKERMSESELKAVYLTSRKNVIGSIVHYYLSYLPYDEPHYHEYALKQTISRFGNLLPLAKLKEYIIAAIKFTETRSDIFSREWVKIFNEYTIFDPETKKEYRIDRLQIKDDLILIVDYKTGKITDKEQLDRYKTIVSGLDYVKKGKYRIETEYITLELTGISEE
jgi:ATP-dependent exoDNAse (exonuclease V) beta subunit